MLRDVFIIVSSIRTLYSSAELYRMFHNKLYKFESLYIIFFRGHVQCFELSFFLTLY
jgi:hypothetical protein